MRIARRDTGCPSPSPPSTRAVAGRLVKNLDSRPGQHDAILQALDVTSQARHAMRTDAPQIGRDQIVRHDLGILNWYVKLLKDTDAKGPQFGRVYPNTFFRHSCTLLD